VNNKHSCAILIAECCFEFTKHIRMNSITSNC